MTIPLGGSMRRIDPEAEVERLTARRVRPAHLLCDEMQEIALADGTRGFLYVRVTCTLPPGSLTTALGAELGEVVRRQCYGGGS